MIASSRTLRSLWRAASQQNRYQQNHTRRFVVGSSSSWHAISWSGHRHDDKNRQRRQQQLQGLPVVAATTTNSLLVSHTLLHSSIPPQQRCEQSYVKGQQRWLSSTTNNKSQEASTPSKEHGTENDNNDKTQHHESSTLRERAAAYQVRARQRAGEMRESAVGHYHEFREHPRESARKGAQTVGGMIKRYGPIFVGTYFTVYVSTLGLLFVGVESGVLDPVSLFSLLGSAGAVEGEEAKNTVSLVVEFMNNHSDLEPYSHYIEKNPSVANLAVAWIAVKFTEPIRLALTLGITPRVARSVGWTVPTEAEEHKEDEKAENKATNDEVDSTTLYKESTKKNNAESVAKKS